MIQDFKPLTLKKRQVVAIHTAYKRLKDGRYRARCGQTLTPKDIYAGLGNPGHPILKHCPYCRVKMSRYEVMKDGGRYGNLHRNYLRYIFNSPHNRRLEHEIIAERRAKTKDHIRQTVSSLFGPNFVSHTRDFSLSPLQHDCEFCEAGPLLIRGYDLLDSQTTNIVAPDQKYPKIACYIVAKKTCRKGNGTGFQRIGAISPHDPLNTTGIDLPRHNFEVIPYICDAIDPDFVILQRWEHELERKEYQTFIQSIVVAISRRFFKETEDPLKERIIISAPNHEMLKKHVCDIIRFADMQNLVRPGDDAIVGTYGRIMGMLYESCVNEERSSRTLSRLGRSAYYTMAFIWYSKETSREFMQSMAPATEKAKKITFQLRERQVSQYDYD